MKGVGLLFVEQEEELGDDNDAAVRRSRSSSAWPGGEARFEILHL